MKHEIGTNALVESAPKMELQSGHYTIRFARDDQDLDAVFRLRYEVFNLELDEGLESSHETGRDRDEFDEACYHLMVQHKKTGELVGTYRLQTYEAAHRHRGFYSNTEFDLSLLPQDVVENSVELGRACIATGHRNGRVLILLWRAICKFIADTGNRYCFGCCSINSQDPVEGYVLMDYLQHHGHTHPEFVITPQPGFSCEIDDLANHEQVIAKVPTLMQLYLNYGVKVCGVPAIDRIFKTIDFFILFDTKAVNPHTKKILFL